MQYQVKDSDIEFTKCYNQYNKNWSMISAFRSITDFSLPLGVEDYEKYTMETLNHMKPGGIWENVLKNSKAFWNSDEPEKLARKAARDTFENSKNIISCVSLVFAHSILEDYLYKLLQIAYDIDHSLFFQFIKDQKVKVSDVVNDPSACIKLKLDGWFINANRASLMEKMDFLYLVCTPSKKPIQEGNYTFDRKRLKILDESRHIILHEPNISKVLSNLENDFWYLHRTGPHFLYLMHKKFDLKIVPAAL